MPTEFKWVRAGQQADVRESFFAHTHEQGNVWVCDPNKKVLIAKDGYWIDIKDFEKNTLDWLLHLGDKSWFTPTSFESLMDAYKSFKENA